MKEDNLTYQHYEKTSFLNKGLSASLYIHQYTCISPQHTANNEALTLIEPSANGKLTAIEPALEGVPPGMLRRMSKAVRMGIGAGLLIIKENDVDGIIIGTANGGMEDCIKFLNQIVEYDEGMLTPGNFVQSTPNALAGQLGLLTKNRSYNVTHVHLGLAFENALIDAKMMVQDNPGKNYLVGGVDEISTYNYHIDFLSGWYDEHLTNNNMYTAGKPATIAGEGAAMFLVNDKADGAWANITAVETLHTKNIDAVKQRFARFLAVQDIDASKTIFMSGENGDTRLNPFYEACEEQVKEMPIIRFKHLTGEYPTATSFAVWLACKAFQTQQFPGHLYKNKISTNEFQHILLYNLYHGNQHSFILISKTRC